MKKFIMTLIVSVVACMSINAENEMNNNMAEEVATTQIEKQSEAEAQPAVEAQTMDNGLMLVYPNLYAESNQANSAKSMAANYDDQGYRNSSKWKSGRTLRTVGMVLAGVGAVGFVAGVAEATSKKDDAGKSLGSAFTASMLIGAGAIDAAVGGILWAVGNNKMKNARLSYTGTRLSYNF